MENSNEADRQELLSIYSDVFKDANGFRPRGILWPADATVAELEAKLEALHADIQAQLDEDQYQEEKTLFETFYGDE